MNEEPESTEASQSDRSLPDAQLLSKWSNQHAADKRGEMEYKDYQEKKFYRDLNEEFNPVAKITGLRGEIPADLPWIVRGPVSQLPYTHQRYIEKQLPYAVAACAVFVGLPSFAVGSIMALRIGLFSLNLWTFLICGVVFGFLPGYLAGRCMRFLGQKFPRIIVFFVILGILFAFVVGWLMFAANFM